jgi:DNA modification methylase
MVQVFDEVRRILKADGTVWVNMGDAYATNGYQSHDKGAALNEHCPAGWKATGRGQAAMKTSGVSGLKPKDLIGLPWRVAFALQAAGWYLRSDIIWSKPNPMPESITDRPTKAHEYVFLLAKSERYYYDQDSIREPLADTSIQRINQPTFDQQTGGPKDYGTKSNRSMRKTLVNFRKNFNSKMAVGGSSFVKGHSGYYDPDGKLLVNPLGRNKRTVWEITVQPYSEAHFATYPEDLVEPCILAGCPAEGIVIDPFMGSGTTGSVALRLNRQFIGFELNPEYVRLANKRIFNGCKTLDSFEEKKATVET